MNKEYINKLYEENKEEFNDKDITSIEDLEHQLLAYITSNMQYDFNIDIDLNELLKHELKSKLEMKEDLEVNLQYDAKDQLLYIGTPSSSGCEYSCKTAEEVADLTKEYILDTAYYLSKENELEEIDIER